MTRDMTSGNPTKLILEFSVPMLIGNFFQQFYSMIDTIIVGKTIGVDALAAVGSTGSINFMIIGFIIGLSNGFGIMVAQRFGANDKNGVKKAVTMSLYLSIIMAIIVTAVSLITSMPLLKLLNTPSSIIHDANTYISIIYMGIIATISYNLIASILRAFGNSKAPFYIMIISSLANIVFNLIFILVLKLGVAGSALGTDCAQVLSCILGFMVVRNHEMLRIKKRDWKIDIVMLKKLVILGIPAAIQNSVTAVGSMLLQAIVNGYGAVCVAGFTAGMRIMSLIEQPGMTFGLAMATYAGQNLGAKKYDRISLGIRKCIKMSTLVNLTLSLLIIIFRHQIIGLFVASSETGVFKISSQYMIVTCLFVWDLGLLFIYRSALQGMGNTIIPMISGVLELGLRLLFGLTLPLILNFLGICFAEISAWIGAELLLMISYYMLIKKLKAQPVKVIK